MWFHEAVVRLLPTNEITLSPAELSREQQQQQKTLLLILLLSRCTFQLCATLDVYVLTDQRVSVMFVCREEQRQRCAKCTKLRCIKRHFLCLRPPETEWPTILPVCRRPECFEACGKQVLICYLGEKLGLNEGFTSYNQS